MKRKHLRALLLTMVGAGFVLAFVGRAHRHSLEHVVDVSRLRGEALPELLQRIRDFRRVVTRNGEKLLEVSASEAAYFRDDTSVVITKPELIFYSQGEKVGSIAGDRGRLMMDGNSVQAVELTGDVHLSLVQFQIDAASLTYERETNTVMTDGPATVRSPEVELSGRGMVFDLERKTLQIDADVKMTLHRIVDADKPRKAPIKETLP